MKKQLLAAAVCATTVTSSALAGPAVTNAGDGFDTLRRPISNPTLFDLAVPATRVHAIYMHQKLPSRINTTLGNLPLDGDFNLYALQIEYALNERLSIVAVKDGYIDFNPDATLSTESGFANIAAGLKYAWILDPASQFALSTSLVIEVPTGDDDVFQGNGNGAANLSVAAVKLLDDWQFAGAMGVHLPFDTNDESITGFASAHVGYNITPCLYALAELNWYSVLSEGNGNRQFNNQVGGAVPAVTNFEGGDLINLGAANASTHGDIVTAAIGLRCKVGSNADVGIAYEIPLTDEKDNLMESRFTLDLVLKF